MLCFPATGQVRNTCMYVVGGGDDMYVKSVEYAARNPACYANTYDYTRMLDLMSASTVTLPSKPKVCSTTDKSRFVALSSCLSILYFINIINKKKYIFNNNINVNFEPIYCIC